MVLFRTDYINAKYHLAVLENISVFKSRVEIDGCNIWLQNHLVRICSINQLYFSMWFYLHYTLCHFVPYIFVLLSDVKFFQHALGSFLCIGWHTTYWSVLIHFSHYIRLPYQPSGPKHHPQALQQRRKNLLWRLCGLLRQTESSHRYTSWKSSHLRLITSGFIYPVVQLGFTRWNKLYWNCDWLFLLQRASDGETPCNRGLLTFSMTT